MGRIYVKASEQAKALIDKVMEEKGLSQEQAVEYLINGKASQSAGELRNDGHIGTENVQTEIPKANEFSRIPQEKDWQKVKLNSGEEYYSCQKGAMETDGLEVYPNVRLLITQPAECWAISKRPGITIPDLQACCEGCQTYQTWERKQRDLMKAQIGHEQFKLKLGVVKEIAKMREKALPDLDAVRAYHQQDWRKKELEERRGLIP